MTAKTEQYIRLKLSARTFVDVYVEGPLCTVEMFALKRLVLTMAEFPDAEPVSEVKPCG